MTVAVTTPPGTSPPDKYGGDPAAFDAAMQAHLTWQTGMIAGLNAQNAENNALNAGINAACAAATTAATERSSTSARTASNAANSATVSAATATFQAQAAATNTNAPLWVSGTTYALGLVVYSPSTYRSYRRKVAGAGTTDPASDSTNWGLLTLEISTGYPAIRPSLNLDFANSRTVDPRITFTRASTATRVNARGLIETVLSGVPRIDFDPITGECEGLLIEEARTNLLIYSEQLDNAAWSKTRSSVTPAATTAPDGSTTADKLAEDATAEYSHVVNRLASPAIAANTAHTVTVFAKSAGRTQMFLMLTNSGYTSSAKYLFDLSAATVGSALVSGTASAYSASITSVGNGWYRCVVTAIVDAVSTAANINIELASGGASVYTGDGTSGIYIWGAQLEAGAFPTSYIPTAASQVTRAAEVAVMTGVNFSSWWRQDEGSFAVTATPQVVTATLIQPLVQADAGSSNDRHFIYRLATSNLIQASTVAGGAQQALFDTPALAGGSTGMFAYAYKTDSFAVTANGGAPLTDHIGTLPTLTHLRIGTDASSRFLNGHLKRITYYPSALSAAQLQAISTQ